MAYVVLARRWRPQRFSDLVGQEHVAKTLANAIASDRVAHAFLFTGVRGVGKTTSARILAKALNCLGNPEDPSDAGAGPRTEPCLKCSACLEIALGTDLDVREIDGASYNGVDEVRKLQDSLPFRPARDRYKIVIVDEVHMLSQSAWNAFLKTLEEPPPHVKFIFATTEAHKIPITILSRVQRFDFKLIPARLIAARLRHVLDTEQVRYDAEAVSILAREAAGSMRDAMSLLDQVMAWNDKELTGESVARVLGVATRQVLYDIARSVLAADAQGALAVVALISNQGYDTTHVARNLLALFRDLVVVKVCADSSTLLDASDVEQQDIAEIAKSTDADDLIRLHQGFAAGFDAIARSGQPRAALEMLLVRLARRPPLIPIDDLISRLAALERRLNRGPGEASSPASSAPPRSGGRPAPALPTSNQARAFGGPSPMLESAKANGAPSSAEVAPLPVELETDPTLNTWHRILERLHGPRPELAAVLAHAVPVELTTEKIRILWPQGSFFSPEHTDALAIESLSAAAEACLGARPEIRFESDPTNAQGARTLASVYRDERARKADELVERARTHPAVREAIDVLGARLKDVRLRD